MPSLNTSGSTKDLFVGLVGNKTCDRVKDTPLQTTVTDKADDRHAEAGVDRKNSPGSFIVSEMQLPKPEIPFLPTPTSEQALAERGAPHKADAFDLPRPRIAPA